MDKLSNLTMLLLLGLSDLVQVSKQVLMQRAQKTCAEKANEAEVRRKLFG